MNILSEHHHIPFGPYLVKMNVSLDFCKRLLKIGKKLTVSHHPYLAGQIHHEYIYDLGKHPWIEEEFKIYINTWIDGFRQFSESPNFNPKYKLDALWINFQKSKEYNPTHIHTNCNLSFALFLEVPKKILKEKRISKGDPPGYTVFFYGEENFGVKTHQRIRPEVGTLLMFPARLRHHVPHFNSKVTRTTVSGNVRFL